MVHRPADSRLLSNLVSHEKEYHKELLVLLDHSHASLSSFSAYAAASPPVLSHAIVAVAGNLAAADDALRRYAVALEQWRARLKELKDLEEDVASIIRDREILVTRLLKASKSTKPSRDSVVATSPSSSSLVLSLTGSKLTAAQAELQACEAHLAEKERALDALRVSCIKGGLEARCKALVECAWTWGEMGKEGLRALEEIGSPEAIVPGSPSRPTSQFFKPLPDPTRINGHAMGADTGHGPASDLSSITPSHSASQIALVPDDPVAGPSTPPGSGSAPAQPSSAPATTQTYTLRIPPAHAISDLAVPSPVVPARSVREANGSADRRRVSMVAEEDEDAGGGAADGATGSSAEEEAEAEDAGFEVVENERFKAWTKEPASPGHRGAFSLRASPKKTSSLDTGATGAPNGRARFPDSDTTLRGTPAPKKRERRASGSFFGGLAGLFSRHSPSKGASSPAPSPEKERNAGGGKYRWQTRTDRNLARSGRRGDDSSDDEGAMASTASAPAVTIWAAAPGANGNGTARQPSTTTRLKKEKSKKRRTAQEVLQDDDEKERAGTGAGAGVVRTPSRKSERAKPLGANTNDTPAGSSPLPRGSASVTRNSSNSSTMVNGVASGSSHVGSAGAGASAGATPSRQNSTASKIRKGKPTPLAVPLHADPETPKRTGKGDTHAAETPKARAVAEAPSTPATPSLGKKRRAHSVDLGSPAQLTNGISATWATPGADVVRRASVDAPRPAKKAGHQPQHQHAEAMNLMSIVEGVTRQNRDAWDKHFTYAEAGAGADALHASPRAPERTGSLDKAPRSSPRAAPASAPAPAVQKAQPASVSSTSSTVHNPTHGLKPLKSALRHSSRTPSPAPGAHASRAHAAPAQGAESPSPPAAAARPRSPLVEDDDSVSISSYETGHETFFYESPALAGAALPLPVPAEQEREKGEEVGEHTGTDISTSTSSTSTATAPARRKSVRMALPPTFSKTPPALDDDRDEREPSWSTGPRTPTKDSPHRHSVDATPDMWEDSSEEDADYRRARKLLHRVKKKAK